MEHLGTPLTHSRLLVGEWHPWLRDPIDLLRYAFIGATLAWAATQHWTAVGLAISSAVLLWARSWRIPRPYDLALIVALFLISWGVALSLYQHWRYYDKLVHTLSPALWLPALYLVFVRLGVLPKLEDLETRHNRVGLFLILWAVGLSVGAAYEIIEWIATTTGIDGLTRGLFDTETDLICDLGGSAVGAAFFVLWTTRGWGETRRKRGAALRS